MSSLNAGSVWSASLPGYCIRRDGPRAALQPLPTAVGEMWAVSSKYSKNVSRDGADRPDLGPGLQRQDLFQDPFLFCRGHICVSTPGQGVLMQGRGTSDLKHTLTASATFFGSSRIRCTTDLAAPSSLQVGSPVKRLHTTPPPQPAIKCSARGHPCAHPHQLFVGPRLDQNLSDCRSGLLLFAVDDTRQADPGEQGSLQRGMAASQAGGFQGLVFPLPEGQKLQRLFFPLCTLHETRLDRRPRSGRTNQVGLGLQLDG